MEMATTDNGLPIRVPGETNPPSPGPVPPQQ